MSYTLGEAAKATGKNKSTINRAIKAGRISAERQDDGSYRIDPAELHRVFPVQPGYAPAPVALHQYATSQSNPVALAVLEERVRNLEQQLRNAEQQRDQWHEQAERLTLLLSAVQPSQPAPDPQPQPVALTQEEQPRTWWQRLIKG